MSTRPQARRKNPGTGRYYLNLVPLSVIRQYARAIAERFHPDKIILFGSYAYGTPTPHSDVDLLVVMPTKNQVDQAVRIAAAVERGFAMDLLVRTPKTLERRLRWGDDFLREIIERGKVLYEKGDGPVGKKGGKRLQARLQAAKEQAPAQGSHLLKLPTGRRKVPESVVAPVGPADQENA